MPRRRIPNSSVPRRLDRRRSRGNATDAQHRPHRGRRGQVEAIAERRVRALELRKAGSSYRQIAKALAIDTHTAWADVAAELADIRDQTVEQAHELRALELERLDGMTSGLWPRIQEGSAAAVSAGVRVSERRSRLLGLDEPVVTKSELSGSVSVAPETHIKAQVEELRDWLSFEELVALGAASDKLFTDALALAKARRTQMTIDVSPSPAAGVDDVAPGELGEQSTAPTNSDQPDAAGADKAP